MTPPPSTAARLARPVWRSSRAIAFDVEMRQVLFILAHIPLGLLLRRASMLVDLHSLGVVALGVLWSTSARSVHRTVLAAAYVASAEVLWRMSGGSIFYEYGKYAVSLLLILAFLRVGGRLRSSWIPVAYFVALLPSITQTISRLGLTEEARQEVSFNLSGPLALAVCAFLFSGVHATSLDLRRLMVTLAAPILGISAIAGRSTLSADRIVFTTQSNFVTSGGFGPNQVSAILGLGALLLVLLLFQTQTRLWKVAYLALAMLAMTQAVLTFSRGGVLNALVCIGVLGLHFLPHRRTRIAFVVTLVLGGLIGTKVVLPALDRWTGGYLTERYTDLDPGMRRSLAERDLRIWKEHPILGVGPGMAKYQREGFFMFKIAAHTEYTRLLAEHGMFGLLALLALVALSVRAYLQAPDALSKAWVAVFAAWSMLEMSHAAMRIAAISFAFGLAMLRWSAPSRKARRRAPPPSTPQRLPPRRPRPPPASGGRR